MATQPVVERRKHDSELEERRKGGLNKPAPTGVYRSLGLGLITGASDDDPSAIGTYAAAGAALGPSFLWTAPVTLPMMFAVVYLCSKLGQVAGKGLFAVIRDHYPRWQKSNSDHAESKQYACSITLPKVATLSLSIQ